MLKYLGKLSFCIASRKWPIMLNWRANSMSLPSFFWLLQGNRWPFLRQTTRQSSCQLRNKETGHCTKGTWCGWDRYLVLHANLSKHCLQKFRKWFIISTITINVKQLRWWRVSSSPMSVSTSLINWQLRTSMWLTVFGMSSMSPTRYNVAFAGKYQRSWNFLILSASHFLICSSNPIGNLLLSLFSECKYCNNYTNKRKE